MLIRHGDEESPGLWGLHTRIHSMGTLVTYSGVNDDGEGADEVGGGGDAYAATNEGGGWFGLHAFMGETREG